MKLPDDNLFDSGELSDSQLDELLGLATPKLDRRRQRRLHRNLRRVLKANRKYSAAGFLPVGLVVTACCGLLLAWVGWGYLNHSENVPTAFAGVSGSTDPDSVKAAPSVTRNSSPPIITRLSSRTRKRRSSYPFKMELEKQRALLVRQMSTQFENGLLKLAETRLGRDLAEDFLVLLDSYPTQNMKVAAGQRLRSARTTRPAHERRVKTQYEILHSCRGRIESLLAARLNRSTRDSTNDVAAYQLLCRVGSRNSLPTILKHWNNLPTQPDAVSAAIRLADTRTLGRLILETSRHDLQSQMMASLLCREDPQSLDLFLELTAKYDLYAVAQESGAIAKCVPMEQLLNRLGSNRLSIARAAAITMSEMDDPRIPQHLVELAVQPESKQSAVMALTARSDPASLRFVELASADLRWSATVTNEKRKWSRWLADN